VTLPKTMAARSPVGSGDRSFDVPLFEFQYKCLRSVELDRES
jgi:hypothetical protein